MKKLEVRQAIAMAIDKERLVRAEKGLGTPATGGMFSPLSPFFQDGLSQPFDPARAKELMAEAGHEDGFDISLITKNYTPWKEPGETIQQDLAEIGIRVSPKYLERDAYSAAVSEYPAALTFNGWELPYPHGSYVMDSAYTTAAKKTTCCNFAYWSDPEFDKMVAEAHAATEQAEVAELYKTMDRMTVHDEVLFVPLYYPKHAEFVSSRLKGYAVPKTPIAEVKFFADYSLTEA
jgi:ABC-type transport system substrate-binding protein